LNPCSAAARVWDGGVVAGSTDGFAAAASWAALRAAVSAAFCCCIWSNDFRSMQSSDRLISYPASSASFRASIVFSGGPAQAVVS